MLKVVFCPEDCGYCGQSRDVKQKSQRYALIPENQIVDGAKVASENKMELTVLL